MKNLNKGRIGELVVAQELMAYDLPVFLEFGGVSRIDLVTIYKDKPLTIQVKTTHSKDGIALLNLRKHGRWAEYNYIYNKEDFDLFALYVVDKAVVLYISSEEALNNNVAGITFRFDPAKNGQKAFINYASDYIGVDKLGRVI